MEIGLDYDLKVVQMAAVGINAVYDLLHRLFPAVFMATG